LSQVSYAARKRVAKVGLNRSRFATMNLIHLPENTYEGSKCMRGDQTGYYYRPGETNVWVFHLQGGGGCRDYISCKGWANDKGSLEGYETTKEGKYWWSADPEVNPLLHNAHHVVVPYCTGDTHAGQVGVLPDPSIEIGQQSDLAPWGNYYFDGHLNIAAILSHLRDSENVAFGSMTEILFSGQSAGGAGVFKNCNFFAQDIHSKANLQVSVSCVSDAGWFVPAFAEDQPDDIWGAVTDFEDWRVNQLTPRPTLETFVDPKNEFRPEACLAAHPSSPWVCGSASGIYPHIEPPIFIIQNQFDSAMLRGGINLDYATEASQEGHEYMAYFGQAQLRSVRLVIESINRGRKKDGLFLPSCYGHAEIGPVKGFDLVQALLGWFGKSKDVPPILLDDCTADGAGVSPGTACGACARAPRIQEPCPAVMTAICGGTETFDQCMECARTRSIENKGGCTHEDKGDWCELNSANGL